MRSLLYVIFSPHHFSLLFQVLPPSVPSPLPDSYKAKIGLLGCGPASISCATFLARLGYNNVTCYEKEEFTGGLNASELPAYR